MITGWVFDRNNARHTAEADNRIRIKREMRRAGIFTDTDWQTALASNRYEEMLKYFVIRQRDIRHQRKQTCRCTCCLLSPGRAQHRFIRSEGTDSKQ